jgi:hypothetical protein
MWGRGCKTKPEPLSKSSERFDPCQYFLFLACVLVEVFRGKDVERRFSMWKTPLFLLGGTLLPSPCSWNFRTPRCPMFSSSHVFFNVLALPPLPHFFYQQHPSRFSALISASFFWPLVSGSWLRERDRETLFTPVANASEFPASCRFCAESQVKMEVCVDCVRRSQLRAPLIF